MPEVLIPNTEGKLLSERPAAVRASSSLARSLSFKYYIHDTVSTLRFQLIGDLRVDNIKELVGSWETARTTLNGRTFLMDVCQLYSLDDEGRAWLLKMRDTNAQFLPANYLDAATPHRPQQTRSCSEAVKLSVLGRVLGFFRTERQTRALD